MKIDLSGYENLNICVAVSGGRDSMALLHYLLSNGANYGINVSAVNFDHKMREESSARDSAFVAEYCRTNGVPLLFFKWDEEGIKTEESARAWRRQHYLTAAELFNAVIATAHHLNDNAETVLFNLARGSGLAGLTGICDTEINSGDRKATLIRPLIGCSREEIDQYITENKIPYVDDETNFTDDYTRNKIRHNVLPELEKAVPNASKAIYRFSRIAAEDEQFFRNVIEEKGLVAHTPTGYTVAFCAEKPLFKRAVLQVFADGGIKDYTFEHLERLYGLQFAENGKRFEFLGYTAYREEGKIAICEQREKIEKVVPFAVYEDFIDFAVHFSIRRCGESEAPPYLYFDFDKVPKDAVIRTRRAGDKITKFGGGTKSLGDFLTDRKIPTRMRDLLPVIAVGQEVLAVIGVEISDKIKVDEGTKNTFIIVT